MATPKKSVLFICLAVSGLLSRSASLASVLLQMGFDRARNICRSPMAEAVFLKMIEDKNLKDQWEVDSAALGTWHIGHGPDKRTMQTLEKNGITNYVHKARAVCAEDYTKYDVIFGMDEDNMEELESRKPSKCTARLQKLGEYDPEGELIIRDPYFDARGDMSGFEDVYRQCVRCCAAFLEKS